MNDTERDLRELLESKAREAGAPAPVTHEILRRGRRRQLGTVAVAGLTSLAVAATAVMGLQALDRADTAPVPGGPRGNPAFTASIANFTLAVPQGWTLIDQTPLAAATASGSSERGSCEGTAVEAGGGGGGGASSDANTTCETTDPANPIPVDGAGLPVLQLSNFDPGLDGTVCGGEALPAGGVVMFVAIDAESLARPEPSTEGPWPKEMVDTTGDPGPGESWPCGVGGYAWFQAGGLPYFVWGGFGSDFSDEDRATMLDAFHGMQVSEDQLSGPSIEEPGYVVTGDAGAGWSISVSPTDVNVDMAFRDASGVGGVADFTVPDLALELSDGHAVVFGAVTFEAERVELRPADGSAPIAGTILELPAWLDAPFDAFTAPGGIPGELVAVGPEGDVGSQQVGGRVAPDPGIRAVMSHLRNAYVAAKTYFTDGDTYEGFTPEVATSIDPDRTFNSAAQAVAGEVSIRDAGADRIVLAEATEAGQVLCIAEQPDGSTTHGALDAQTAAECVGGEAAWGQTVPTSFPPTSVPIDGIASGQSAGVIWHVVVDGDRLALEDEAGSELASASLNDGTQMSAGTYEFGEGDASERVAFGVIRDPVVEVWPGIDRPKWETTLLPDAATGSGGGVVYILQFQGPYDGTILGMAGPCEPVVGFEILGTHALATPTVPTWDCESPASVP